MEDVSAATSSSIREEIGSDIGRAESGSGFGFVRALATLHALAPRSRILGNRRLIS